MDTRLSSGLNGFCSSPVGDSFAGRVLIGIALDLPPREAPFSILVDECDFAVLDAEDVALVGCHAFELALQLGLCVIVELEVDVFKLKRLEPALDAVGKCLASC